jgi:dethiobiotin synthase
VRRGLFVTGTDTGVGKTVVSAALLHRYRRDLVVRYWKPIQTGIEEDDDTAEVARLTGDPGAVLAAGIRLRRPVSPHLAARMSGTTLPLDEVARPLNKEGGFGAWIVEGAGGALVPINETDSMTDLMLRLGLPVVVVARSTLGTINHTRLTLEALRRRSLAVAGVVLVGPANRDNREAIETYGETIVLGEMPRFDPLTVEALASWAPRALDPHERLLEFLR